MYPRLIVDIKKLKHNAIYINRLCLANQITTRFLVTKVLAGNIGIVERLLDCGYTHIADSRLENLRRFRNLPLPKVLLRIPMLSEVERVIKYADISLNSETKIIGKLNTAARKARKHHQIILMFDLGDLREGIYFTAQYLDIVEAILCLSNIRLIGIGTNLTCYGGVIPSEDVLKRLIDIKTNIEFNLGIKLDIISGGNSSNIHLIKKNNLPPEINNLRLGESIMLGRETAYGQPIDGTYQDAFILEAQIIELKTKPSYPQGEIGSDSFGKKPKIIDHGLMRRGILALGKQDIDFANLTPLDKNTVILGGSSDHLIVNLTKSKYRLNDIVRFRINYPGLLQAMTSEYVKKKLIN